MDQKKILLNDFATRSFRDVADYDYIAARMAYRAHLGPQFLWCSLQAIEKYLKCILLLNRIPAKKLGHDLGRALELVENRAPFKLRLRTEAREFIKHLDTYGRFRYLETPFYIMGLQLMQLDRAVWDIRRYCRVLDYEIRLADGRIKHMLDVEIRMIEDSETKPPQAFRFVGEGMLEKIVANKKHPAREPLIWQNLFFGKKPRKRIHVRTYSYSSNSPLSMRPEILDDVLNYVFLPKDVIAAYRDNLRKTKKSDHSAEAT